MIGTGVLHAVAEPQRNPGVGDLPRRPPTLQHLGFPPFGNLAKINPYACLRLVLVLAFATEVVKSCGCAPCWSNCSMPPSCRSLDLVATWHGSPMAPAKPPAPSSMASNSLATSWDLGHSPSCIGLPLAPVSRPPPSTSRKDGNQKYPPALRTALSTSMMGKTVFKTYLPKNPPPPSFRRINSLAHFTSELPGSVWPLSPASIFSTLAFSGCPNMS